MTNEQLLDLSQQGDQEAFNKLFRRHYPRVVEKLLRRIRCRDAAEDIAQRVFIKLNGVQGYDPCKDFRRYLSAVVANTRTDYYRARTTRDYFARNFSDLDPQMKEMIETGKSKYLADKNGTPLDHLEAKHDGAMVMEQFEELEPELKLAVQGLTLDELSSRDVSDTTDVSHKSIQDRNRKGLKLIRQRLAA